MAKKQEEPLVLGNFHFGAATFVASSPETVWPERRNHTDKRPGIQSDGIFNRRKRTGGVNECG
ncbi:MAG: hypothetical protein RR581_07740 [Eubacterium sp.]